MGSEVLRGIGWVTNFVRWYSTERLHSGLNFVAPDRYLVETSPSSRLVTHVYGRARAKHPERWSGGTAKGDNEGARGTASVARAEAPRRAMMRRRREGATRKHCDGARRQGDRRRRATPGRKPPRVLELTDNQKLAVRADDVVGWAVRGNAVRGLLAHGAAFMDPTGPQIRRLVRGFRRRGLGRPRGWGRRGGRLRSCRRGR